MDQKVLYGDTRVSQPCDFITAKAVPHSEAAARFNTGKLRYSLVLEAPEALAGLAHVLEFGAQKYERSNWTKGLPLTQIIDSLLRHTVAFMQGEDLDIESQLPHVDHMLCNALFLAQLYRANPECDDRLYKEKT